MHNFQTKNNFKQGIWNRFIILLVRKSSLLWKVSCQSLGRDTQITALLFRNKISGILCFNPIGFHKHEKLIPSRVSVHE